MADASPVPVWDLPVRATHWLVAASIPALWWTAEHDALDWHKRIGLVVLGLVAFRLLWGVFGGSTARFSHFLKGPRDVAAYAAAIVSGRADPKAGHNPMGGWSVAALLAVLAVETVLGLFCVDVDGLESGPLADRVSFEAGRLAAHWHHLLFNALLGLVALHLCAIGVYLFIRRDNLLGPMVTGARRFAGEVEPLRPAPAWRALALGLAAAALAVVLARGGRLF